MSKNKNTANNVHSNLDLDALLEQALDDFELLEAKDNAKEIMNKEKPINLKDQRNAEKHSEMSKMMETMNEINNPSSGLTVQSTLRELSGTAAGCATVDDLFKRSSMENDDDINTRFVPMGPSETNPDNLQDSVQSADREVAATLKMIAEAQKGE